MRPDGVGSGSRISSAPTKRRCRRTNVESGDGFCQTQPSVERLEAFTSNPRLGIRRRAPTYRRTGGKIAQAQKIRARVEIAERAEANAAEIARAPRGADIARAISSSGKPGKDDLEKAPSVRARTSPFHCRK